MARKFFYIAAGMLMLALSYHFGASTAGAQGANQLCAATNDGGNANWAVGSDGGLYEQSRSGGGLGPWYPIRTIPVTSRPVALSVLTSGGDTAFYLFTEDGTVYAWVGWQGDYTTSNVFGGGPTPASHQSWGQVKARYQNTPGMTVTPGTHDR